MVILGGLVGGVHGDGDAGDTGVDHFLDHDSHREALVRDVVLEPVDDGAGGEKRGPALADVLGDCLDAVEPEVGVLLAGEGGVREVLGGGAERTATGTGASKRDIRDS